MDVVVPVLGILAGAIAVAVIGAALMVPKTYRDPESETLAC